MQLNNIVNVGFVSGKILVLSNDWKSTSFD
jgi:hypothetical protein